MKLPLEFQAAVEVFAAAFSLSPARLLQRTRVRHVAEPRFALMRFCHLRLDMTGRQIGELLGLTHNSASYGIIRAGHLIFSDRFFAAKVKAAEAAFDKQFPPL